MLEEARCEALIEGCIETGREVVLLQMQFGSLVTCELCMQWVWESSQQGLEGAS